VGRSPTCQSLGSTVGDHGSWYMSEPIIYLGIGFLVAIVLVLIAKALTHSRMGRFAVKRLEAAAPKLMADIEADMSQLHAQIAMATRRLETGVEQMKSKTTSQLSEIGKTSETIARLKAELGEKTTALQALAAKERVLDQRLHLTEAELALKTGALQEVERKLANEKAELDDLLAFVDARDKLAEADNRHAAAVAGLKAENASLQQQLGQSFDDYTKLEHEMATMRRQVEATWASERMANAVLRERINDVAGEVVRVAHALEGLGSPIETMLAGKADELEAMIGLPSPNGGNGSAPMSNGGDDTKGSLARRIRSLQKRASRVASSGGT
jgi:chromosome segregation ATPase